MSYYRILSIDGGGIRGVLSITILQRLEQLCPGFLSTIDLFAGTSTGGILALSLAAGLEPAEVLKLYEVKGKIVFADSLLDNIRDAGLLLGSQYDNKGLKQELTNQFGNKTLGDLPHKVIISSFDLDNGSLIPGKRSWKPKFFHNFPEPARADGTPRDDRLEKIVDVAIRTAAAPVFFPIYQGYADGGVVANNPSMCALAQALDSDTGNQRLSRVAMLSVGTGGYPGYLEVQDAAWGVTQWGLNLVNVMMEGSTELAHYQCSRLLSKRYMRLNPALPRKVDLGSIKEIPLLKEVGRQVELDDAKKWVDKYFLS